MDQSPPRRDFENYLLDVEVLVDDRLESVSSPCVRENLPVSSSEGMYCASTILSIGTSDSC